MGNCNKNAPSTIIVRPGKSFNFHSSEIHFFKSCGAHFISKCAHAADLLSNCRRNRSLLSMAGINRKLVVPNSSMCLIRILGYCVSIHVYILLGAFF